MRGLEPRGGGPCERKIGKVFDFCRLWVLHRNEISLLAHKSAMLSKSRVGISNSQGQSLPVPISADPLGLAFSSPVVNPVYFAFSASTAALVSY